jgi:hypothetical protein
MHKNQMKNSAKHKCEVQISTNTKNWNAWLEISVKKDQNTSCLSQGQRVQNADVGLFMFLRITQRH